MIIENPLLQFTDNNATPLNFGYVYIGEVNKNPELFPVSIYWDDALTIPAQQPVRTINGYIVRNSTVSTLYSAVNYSIAVKNKDGVLIYSLADSAAVNSLARLSKSDGASLVGFIQDGSGTVARTVEEKLQEWVSVKDFGAAGDGVTDDTAAFVAATATGVSAFVPESATSYIVSALTNAQIELLYGPGVVVIGGVITPIPSTAGVNNAQLPVTRAIRRALAPASNTPNGSVGRGISSDTVVRSGGFGQYGNHLSEYLITAAVPAGQFDVDDTSWVTATNLTGGTVYGKWPGANTPSSALGETFTSGAAVGQETNVGNRWGDFGLLTDIGVGRYTIGHIIVPDVLPTMDTSSAVVSISVATPAVAHIVGHGYTAGLPVVFAGAGLPTGVTAGTVYYVIAAGLGADDFQFSATYGGAAINTSGSSTGTQTVIPSYPGSFAEAIGHSIWGHKWWVGNFVRANSIMPLGHIHLANGGSSASQAVGSFAKMGGYFFRGLDFTGATFSQNAILFGADQTIGWGGASITGNATTFGVSTGGAGAGGLYGNNYATAPFKWAASGSTPLLSFFGAAVQLKPTITGAKGGNAALTSLLTALSTLGLVTDSTT